MTRTEVIGTAMLHLGDCRESLPTLGRADLIVADPPFDEWTQIPLALSRHIAAVYRPRREEAA